MPSPMIIMCWIRGLLWSAKMAAPVAGHIFDPQPNKPGESQRILHLKCVTCGARTSLWQ